VTRPSSDQLETRYEALRAGVIHGDRASLGVAVVVRQGLAVWMTLVDAEEAAVARVAARETTAAAPSPACPSAIVPSELLAAFVNLVVGAALGAPEV
jgi:hypothetical protein